MLTQLNHVPEGLLDTPANKLVDILDGPTLLHLPGELDPPLFISVLLHGNEETGFLALQQLLRDYRDQELPRSLSIFIGNISAAQIHVRKLEGQPDYNRIWPGCELNDTPEQKMAQQIVDIMAQRNVLASIDIHNTSGHNPHYACINSLDQPFIQLALLFGRTVVYFLRPKGVQTMAFASICPAVTLECGQVVEHGAMNHALSFLKKVISLKELNSDVVIEEDIDLFHTTAIVKLPRDISFEFMNKDEPSINEQKILNFPGTLDDLNFRETDVGTLFAHVKAGSEQELLLNVQSEQDQQVYHKYFSVIDHELRTSRSIMPSMLSVSDKAVSLDCLGYIMERIKTDGTISE